MVTIERMYKLAKNKAKQWKKDYNALLEKWEDVVEELKIYKKLNKKLSMDNRIKDTEINSLKVENDLLKENLIDALKLLDSLKGDNVKNVYRGIDKSILEENIDIISKYENSEVKTEITKDNNNVIKNSFDVKLSDLSKSLKEMRKIDIRA